jgi:hypothetical protein
MFSLLFQWSLTAVLFLHSDTFFIPATVRAGNEVVHPFYVSVTEFNHNTKESTVEISCKMFADDFENNLKRQYKSKIDLTHPQDVKQLEKIIFEYLQKHLQLKVNDIPVTLQFVGFEKDAEAVWCYLQVSGVKSLNKLEIRNSILYEAFDSQINIMHVMTGGQRKSVKLTKPEQTWIFQF